MCVALHLFCSEVIKIGFRLFILGICVKQQKNSCLVFTILHRSIPIFHPERVKMKNNLFYFVKYREKQASYTAKLTTASQFLSVYLGPEYLECS